jgi:hypothetical protein
MFKHVYNILSSSSTAAKSTSETSDTGTKTAVAIGSVIDGTPIIVPRQATLETLAVVTKVPAVTKPTVLIAATHQAALETPSVLIEATHEAASETPVVATKVPTGAKLTSDPDISTTTVLITATHQAASETPTAVAATHQAASELWKLLLLQLKFPLGPN